MRRVLIISLALAFAGCAPKVRTTPLLEQPLPRRPADHPIRLYAETRPDCDFTEVAEVVVDGGTRADPAELVELLKAEARRLGGDAVLSVQSGTGAPVGLVSGPTVMTAQRKTLRGTVVRLASACPSRP